MSLRHGQGLPVIGPDKGHISLGPGRRLPELGKVRRLQFQPPAFRMPQELIIQDALKAGARDFITKPFKEKEFIEKIVKVMKGN